MIAKLDERDARHDRSGRSRYLVEPNLKEGKGGLRDLNTLFWIARYSYQIDRLDDLVNLDVLTGDELKLFRKCDAFSMGGALSFAFFDRARRRTLEF